MVGMGQTDEIWWKWFNHTEVIRAVNKFWELVGAWQHPGAAAPPGFRFGGNILGGRPRRGSGGGAARTPEKFENLQNVC